MATLRKWLVENGFDWNTGRIILQDDHTGCRSYDSDATAEKISFEHPRLDQEFDAGFGCAEAPSFIAEDDYATYFPSQYDGATQCVRIWRDIEMYLDPTNLTPYP